MGLYVWGATILAVLGFIVWLYRTGKSSGEDSVAVDAQKEALDEQAKVNAARVATADPNSGRAGKLRERFTRK